MTDIENTLEDILQEYQKSFKNKIFNDEIKDHDLLMDVFDLTPELKADNMQYWGRELGMCWQKLIIEICQKNCPKFKPAQKVEGDEPYDLIVGKYAIDTKYRIGSGDSGTLKKLKQYGKDLKQKGYAPIMLILRQDNLPAAITACENGNWIVYTDEDSFKFVQKITKFDLKQFLINTKAKFAVVR